MKTLHTIYNNFAKRVALILTLLSTIGTTAVWAQTTETVTLSDMGARLTTSINEQVAIVTVNTYDIYYRYCKKQSYSGSDAMLMDDSYGTFIANKTAMPGNIKSVTIYALTSAGSASYHCAFVMPS